MYRIPGSVIRVRSRRYGFLFYHLGCVDSPDVLSGETRIIHSEKASFVRTTSESEFSEGGTIETVWVPQTPQQQIAMLHRMHMLEGKPYDLFLANCEHAVNWALTGKSQSPQLALATVILVGIGVAFALRASAAA